MRREVDPAEVIAAIAELVRLGLARRCTRAGRTVLHLATGEVYRLGESGVQRIAEGDDLRPVPARAAVCSTG